MKPVGAKTKLLGTQIKMLGTKAKYIEAHLNLLRAKSTLPETLVPCPVYGDGDPSFVDYCQRRRGMSEVHSGEKPNC